MLPNIKSDFLIKTIELSFKYEGIYDLLCLYFDEKEEIEKKRTKRKEEFSSHLSRLPRLRGPTREIRNSRKWSPKLQKGKKGSCRDSNAGPLANHTQGTP